MRQLAILFTLAIVLLLCYNYAMAQQGLCNDPDDINSFHQIRVQHDQDPDHNPDFKSMLRSCLKAQTIPTPDYVSWCCQTNMKLTQNCASCCGWAVTCVTNNCKWPCGFQSQEACDACFIQYCTPDFHKCIGL